MADTPITRSAFLINWTIDGDVWIYIESREKP
jgi:hypothetical protein